MQQKQIRTPTVTMMRKMTMRTTAEGRTIRRRSLCKKLCLELGNIGCSEMLLNVVKMVVGFVSEVVGVGVVSNGCTSSPILSAMGNNNTINSRGTSASCLLFILFSFWKIPGSMQPLKKRIKTDNCTHLSNYTFL